MGVPRTIVYWGLHWGPRILESTVPYDSSNYKSKHSPQSPFAKAFRVASANLSQTDLALLREGLEDYRSESHTWWLARNKCFREPAARKRFCGASCTSTPRAQESIAFGWVSDGYCLGYCARPLFYLENRFSRHRYSTAIFRARPCQKNVLPVKLSCQKYAGNRIKLCLLG